MEDPGITSKKEQLKFYEKLLKDIENKKSKNDPVYVQKKIDRVKKQIKSMEKSLKEKAKVQEAVKAQEKATNMVEDAPVDPKVAKSKEVAKKE